MRRNHANKWRKDKDMEDFEFDIPDLDFGPPPTPVAPVAPGERDKGIVRSALWQMPLLDVKEMAAVTGLAENRCSKLLKDLISEKQVLRATLGRSKGARHRYWLSRTGVEDVAKETGRPIPWQVTESGLRWLVRRLPMLEEFYALAPKLWSHQGVRIGGRVLLDPGPFEEMVEITGDHKLFNFRWLREGEIHAVVEYQGGVWVAMVWKGSMITEHRLKEKAARAIEQLGGKYIPAGWVIVGHDRLAAWQAGEFWPADNVLAVAADGRVERWMRPGDFSWPLKERDVAARLGNPDQLVGWLDKKNPKHDRAMVALNSPLNYRIFRFIAEWHDVTPWELEASFGESYRAGLRELRNAKLVMKLEGGYFLRDLGRRTVAHMDRVSPKDISRRLKKYLDAEGDYREQQQNHNRSTIDVAIVLRHDGTDTFAGFRGLRHIKGVTRVDPDAVVCLNLGNGSSYPVYLEVELSAAAPSEARKKHRSYLRLQEHLGEEVSLFFVARGETAEQNAQREGQGLPLMLTSTLSRLMEWPDWRYDEVWRKQGDPVDTRWLARLEDTTREVWEALKLAEEDTP